MAVLHYVYPLILWHNICKGAFLMVFVMGLLHSDSILDHHHKLCKQNNLLLFRQKGYKRNLVTTKDCEDSWSRIWIPKFASVLSPALGKCKHNKIYNNYQARRIKWRNLCQAMMIKTVPKDPKSLYKLRKRFKFFLTRNTNEEENKCLNRKDDESESRILRTSFFAAAETLKFTTEDGIFTGLPTARPPTPKPLGPFDVSLIETFGTFTFLRMSWKSEYNVSMVRESFFFR